MHQCVSRISPRSFPDEFFHFLNKEGMRAVDLHFHTEASMDAISHIPNVLAHCKKRSIGVAITDHSVIGGACTAWPLRKRYGAFVIPGLELIEENGSHSLYFFLNLKDCQEFYNKEVKHLFKKNPFFLPVKGEDLMERSKAYNAVTVGVPHPYGPGATGMYKTKRSSRVTKLFELVEGINAVCMPSMNDRALKLAAHLGKHLTAGSDGHTTAELGNAVTIAEGDTVENYLENVRKGKAMILGKEKALFDDALHELWKEHLYLKKAKRHGLAERWITTHFESEISCLKRKVKKYGHEFLHNWHKFHTPLSEKRHPEIKK